MNKVTNILKLIKHDETITTVYAVCPKCDKGILRVTDIKVDDLNVHKCDNCGYCTTIENNEIFPQTTAVNNSKTILYRVPKYDLYIGTILINKFGDQYVLGTDASGNELILFPVDSEKKPISADNFLNDETFSWKKYIPSSILKGKETDLSSLVITDSDNKKIFDLSKLEEIIME
jgi:predicted RNA-binding Zn-ribbon protein involved in translation (DUF1610 family)